MSIPQMFYLRKLTVNTRNAKGIVVQMTFHMFWNYRNTISGTISTTSRVRAKAQIQELHSEAEFWR